jgi:hypothetical protein
MEFCRRSDYRVWTSSHLRRDEDPSTSLAQDKYREWEQYNQYIHYPPLPHATPRSSPDPHLFSVSIQLHPHASSIHRCSPHYIRSQLRLRTPPPAQTMIKKRSEPLQKKPKAAVGIVSYALPKATDKFRATQNFRPGQTKQRPAGYFAMSRRI